MDSNERQRFESWLSAGLAQATAIEVREETIPANPWAVLCALVASLFADPDLDERETTRRYTHVTVARRDGELLRERIDGHEHAAVMRTVALAGARLPVRLSVGKPAVVTELDPGSWLLRAMPAARDPAPAALTFRTAGRVSHALGLLALGVVATLVASLFLGPCALAICPVALLVPRMRQRLRPLWARTEEVVEVALDPERLRITRAVTGGAQFEDTVLRADVLGVLPDGTLITRAFALAPQVGAFDPAGNPERLRKVAALIRDRWGAG